MSLSEAIIWKYREHIKQYQLNDASSQQIPIDDALHKRKDNKTLNLLMYGWICILFIAEWTAFYI